MTSENTEVIKNCNWKELGVLLSLCKKVSAEKMNKNSQGTRNEMVKQGSIRLG